MLPFSTLPTENLDQVGTEGSGYITLPKWGCISLNEQLAIENLAQDIKHDETKGIKTGDARLKARVITILFQSRLDSEWTLEKTLNPWQVKGPDGKVHTIIPREPLIDALYNWFFSGERLRWEPEPETAAEEDGTKDGKKAKK